MKKIIIGQLMMWCNFAAIIIGYHLFKLTNIESIYVQIVIGALGLAGSIYNMIIAISLQTKGYKENNILNFE